MAVLAHVDAVNRTRITGWAVDDTAPGEPVRVDLLMDGEEVASSMARLPRSELADPQRKLRKQGFVLAVPNGLLLDFDRLTLRAGTTTIPLGADQSRDEGVLEQVSPAGISGWAWRIGYPGASVALTVICDGEIIARTRADAFRLDLQEAGVGDGHHGFECALPPGLVDADLTPARLQVVADHSGDVLHDVRARVRNDNGLPPRLELLPTQRRAAS